MPTRPIFRTLASTTHMFKDMRFLMWLPLLCDMSSQATEPVSAHPGDTDVEMTFETEVNNERGDFNVGRNDTEEIPEFQDPRPSNLTEPLNLSPERGNANSPGSVPEVEIRRDAAAAHGLSPASHLPFATEHTEPLDETMNEKEPSIPNLDDEVLSSRGQAFELRSGSPGFAGFEEERDNFGE